MPARRFAPRLLALAALAAVAALAIAAPPPAVEPRVFGIDPWSWMPTRRNNGQSAVMDYFFPPSRTPKVSDAFNKKTIEAKPPPTITLTEKQNDITSTYTGGTAAEPESRTAPSTTRKVAATTTKVKQTTKVLNTSPGNTSAQRTETKTKTTLKATTNLPAAVKNATTVPDAADTIATPKSTRKHYTIQSSSSNLMQGSTAEMTLVPLSSTKDRVVVPNYAEGTTAHTTLSDMVVEGQESRTTYLQGSTYASPETSRTTSETKDSSTSSPAVTDEPDSREGYYQLRDKPLQPTHQTHVKINEQTNKETVVPLPAGSTSVLAKPTKYHYYPHNQHIYLLPECAIQQVCNAVYVRLNYTQPLCACPSRYRDPCSASLNADDLHTTRLTTDSKKKYAKKAVTLVKTCEAVSEMRECRAPRDWSLLALQNIRTGKSHYLVICRCPENHILEGPMSHDQPTYASVPGIRVFGMMCVRPSVSQYSLSGFNTKYTAVSVQPTTSSYKVDYNAGAGGGGYYRGGAGAGTGEGYYRARRHARDLRYLRDLRDLRHLRTFPWEKARHFAQTINWDE